MPQIHHTCIALTEVLFSIVTILITLEKSDMSMMLYLITSFRLATAGVLRLDSVNLTVLCNVQCK